jgi:endonuclease YncB( thermonuclease family)
MAGRPVSCHQVDYDHKNNRSVAVCFAGKDDLQAMMVSAAGRGPIPPSATGMLTLRDGPQRAAQAFTRIAASLRGEWRAPKRAER